MPGRDSCDQRRQVEVVVRDVHRQHAARAPASGSRVERLAREQVDRDRIGAEAIEDDEVELAVRARGRASGGRRRAPHRTSRLVPGTRKEAEVRRVAGDAGDGRVDLVEGPRPAPAWRSTPPRRCPSPTTPTRFNRSRRQRLEQPPDRPLLVVVGHRPRALGHGLVGALLAVERRAVNEPHELPVRRPRHADDAEEVPLHVERFAERPGSNAPATKSAARRQRGTVPAAAPARTPPPPACRTSARRGGAAPSVHPGRRTRSGSR